MNIKKKKSERKLKSKKKMQSRDSYLLVAKGEMNEKDWNGIWGFGFGFILFFISFRWKATCGRRGSRSHKCCEAQLLLRSVALGLGFGRFVCFYFLCRSVRVLLLLFMFFFFNYLFILCWLQEKPSKAVGWTSRLTSQVDRTTFYSQPTLFTLLFRFSFCF